MYGLNQVIKVINLAVENQLIMKILLIEPIVDLGETKFSENSICKIKNSNNFHN